MAIQFDPNALSAFSNVNFGRDDAIANLSDDKKGLVHNGDRGFGVFAKLRSNETQAKNNAVRTELLKALGKAFDLRILYVDGKTTFSNDFMNRLEECLGAAFKREDFGIDANGVVKSGKPLTQRRIRAVCNAAKDFIARCKLDKKFSDATSLLTGSPISAIIGDERDNGWHGSLSNFSELAVGINDAAQKLRNEGDTQTINEEGVEVTLTLTEGRISASLTIGGETRPVENFAKTKEEIQSAMDKTLLDLYDSFTENWSGSTYGREMLRS